MSATKITERPKIEFAGDGQEPERLMTLKPGQVLTEQNVTDIKNLLDDYSNEIDNTVEWIYEVQQQVLADTAPDKQDLVNRIAELEGRLAISQAMLQFEKGMAERRSGLHPPTSSRQN